MYSLRKSFRGNVLLNMKSRHYIVNMQFTATGKCVISVKTGSIVSVFKEKS